MAAKKSGAGTRSASKAKKQPKKAAKGSASDGNELSGGGLSLSDQSRLNGKYEKYESIDERVKEVERVKRFIVANLGRTALGMMKSAEKGTNASGAKLLWELAEIEKLAQFVIAPTTVVETRALAGGTAASGEAEDDDDPTKAVLSFYKKLGMTPPKLKPPKVVEAVEEEAALAPTM